MATSPLAVRLPGKQPRPGGGRWRRGAAEMLAGEELACPAPHLEGPGRREGDYQSPGASVTQQGLEPLRPQRKDTLSRSLSSGGDTAPRGGGEEGISWPSWLAGAPAPLTRASIDQTSPWPASAGEPRERWYREHTSVTQSGQEEGGRGLRGANEEPRPQPDSTGPARQVRLWLHLLRPGSGPAGARQ